MGHYNLLRKQVISERRKRDLTFLLIVLLSIGFIVFNLVFDEMGIRKYWELRGGGGIVQQEIQDARKDIGIIEEEIDKIDRDPYYIEKQAREDLGLSKPDELIFSHEGE